MSITSPPYIFHSLFTYYIILFTFISLIIPIVGIAHLTVNFYTVGSYEL